jgi:hypothetical protein
MKIARALLIVFSAGAGWFMLLKPALAIELQRRFYAKINWRMEPISMQKELRNTKIMGAFLFVFAIATLIYVTIGRGPWISRLRN